MTRQAKHIETSAEAVEEGIEAADEAGMVTLRRGEGDPAPVVFDSPHSGRTYPPGFQPLPGVEALKAYEDRFVDALLVDAPRHGVDVIAAEFPRSYIDPNRALDDLDHELLEADWPEPLAPTLHTERGVGLIFRLMHDSAPIYGEPLSLEEVKGRIEGCWLLYHETLDVALGAAQARHGAVWHVNCHSMRPVGDAMSPDPGMARADFVLGDLEGESCDPDFTRFVADTLSDLGHSVAVNDPYKGAFIVQRHGRPADGRHSLQIEINRALYMDVTTLKKHEGFERVRRDMGRFAEALAGYARERSG